MTQIAHQYDAFYIQRKYSYDAVRAQHAENHSFIQNAKYCDICGQTLSRPKIFDSRIGCFMNYLDNWTTEG